jgi:type I restriction enzyme M protein
MSIENLVKKLQNIVRADAGVDGSGQLISQLVWMLFLKIYDAKADDWEVEGFVPKLDEKYRWSTWAKNEDDARVKEKGETGKNLLDFVNEELFPAIKNLDVSDMDDERDLLLKRVFQDSFNYMKDGTLLREVINELERIDFSDKSNSHTFNDVYEQLLKGLQASGTHGEFYTPRPLTDFVVKMTEPTFEDKIADFACGTGGMLVSVVEHLNKKNPNDIEKKIMHKNIYGQELKPLPYFLATTNMMFHNVDIPNIKRDNSLSGKAIDEIPDFDVLVMNPPYGTTSSSSNKDYAPLDMQSSELSDLFMLKIMQSLKKNGRAGVIIPDGFLFGTDSAKVNIKKKLLQEFNLHTIVRLPAGIFAPYTSITTNVLFFENTQPTEEIWFYEHKVGNGGKSYTKNKQLKQNDFEPEKKWWKNRVENNRAFKVTVDEVIKNGYNLDYKNKDESEDNVDTRELSEIVFSIGENIQKQATAFDELKLLISM